MSNAARVAERRESPTVGFAFRALGLEFQGLGLRVLGF